MSLDTADGTGDAPTIQAALNGAKPGDTVLLAAGTFSWSTQSVADGRNMVVMKSGVRLKGSGPEATVLDAEGKGRVILCWNVIGEIQIEGLTIKNGHDVASYGAGIYANHKASHLAISNCSIRDNQLSGGIFGAGVACYAATISNSSFLGNRCLGGSGGAIISLGPLEIHGSTFENNRASADGFVAGGALFCFADGNVIDCDFENNRAFGNFSASGGALSLPAGNVTGCTFINNSANVTLESSSGLSYGGAVRCSGPVAIANCVFARNTVGGGMESGAGGAIGSSSREPVNVTHCTVIANVARTGLASQTARPIGGIGLVAGDVEACIVAWNVGLAVNVTMETRCSDFFGNSLGDTERGVERGGNFSADPEFCALDPVGEQDFQVRPESPCAPGNHPGGEQCGLIGTAGVRDCSAETEH